MVVFFFFFSLLYFSVDIISRFDNPDARASREDGVRQLQHMKQDGTIENPLFMLGDVAGSRRRLIPRQHDF